MGKCDTVGVTLMLVGLALCIGASLTTVKLVLIAAFIVIINPTATHALGRAAIKSGLRPWTRDGE